MKRAILVAVVALVVGLGAGVGWNFTRAHPPANPAGQAPADSLVADQAPSDSTATDSTRADSARVDSTRVATAHADSVHESTRGRGAMVANCQPSIGDSATRKMTVPALATPLTPLGALRRATPVRPAVSGGIITASMNAEAPRVDTARVGRLARLFAAMSAKDAARVLLALDQADAQLVLSAIDNRHAAEILSNFPPDRAAEMSRLVLRPSQP